MAANRSSLPVQRAFKLCSPAVSHCENTSATSIAGPKLGGSDRRHSRPVPRDGFHWPADAPRRTKNECRLRASLPHGFDSGHRGEAVIRMAFQQRMRQHHDRRRIRRRSSLRSAIKLSPRFRQSRARGTFRSPNSTHAVAALRAAAKRSAGHGAVAPAYNSASELSA